MNAYLNGQTCPKCHRANMTKHPNTCGLSRMTVENGAIALDLDKLIPVESYICSNCGYTEFSVAIDIMNQHARIG